MTARIVVTGAGAILPAGAGIDALADALWSGASAFAFEAFDAAAWLGAKRLRPLDRSARLLCVAVLLALADGGREIAADDEVGLACGTMFGGVRGFAEFDAVGVVAGPGPLSPLAVPNTSVNAPASQAAVRHALRGPNAMVCSGQASGLDALDYAATLMTAGRSACMLAGGMDEIGADSAGGFRGLEPLPVVQGEGAALWLLETEDAARARGVTPRYELAGFGSTHHAGGAVAIAQALAESGISAAEIGCIVAGANGNPERDDAEAAALRATFGERLATIPACAPKGCFGEVLGASGALCALTAGLALDRSEVPPTVGVPAQRQALAFSSHAQPFAGTYALVTSIGENGTDAALVLRRWQG